ncbi:hypothetical protein CCR94_22335 [Rhodoblastus sphagnicola]|uniref:Uncharacterized protein n=1 Tax=Rhodoblastus sphagnicola TaxID=333368 RepID=A0A2S6MVJ3_9HYPH|nr:hypothetical protein [Rhodoblastus sphagnicola]MBB4197524.1 hypothetical protein [Rhodoblastus sphagnicola]PPQ26381.1 hypothetical protein CCR94_22335 [Rhodoblastus sphagnicola]
MGEKSHLEGKASDPNTSEGRSVSLSLAAFISITSFLISIFTFYATSIRRVDALYVSQDGLGKYSSKKPSGIKISTHNFSHLSFANVGNRNLLLEHATLVVFQPGSTEYDDYFLREYTQASGDSSTNRFDNSHCVGDMSAISLNVASSEVKSGDIAVRDLDFSFGTDVGTSRIPQVAPSNEGEDGKRHAIATIFLTDENKSQPTQRFVYCISVVLRNADGKRFSVSRPLWSAELVPKAGNADDLTDGPFKWLDGLDEKVFDQKGWRLLD